MDSSVSSFLKAIAARWFTFMSGALSVPSSIAAVLAPSSAAKIAYGFTALVCLFVAVYWPWRVEREKMSSLQAKLDGIGTLRSLDYRNAAFKVLRNGSSMVVSIIIENTGDYMLRCKLSEIFFELNGAKAKYAPEESEIFIAANKEIAHSFNVEGLHLSTLLPNTITVGFVAKYDNIPPIRERVTARIVKYEYDSLDPPDLRRRTILSSREE